LIEFPAQPSATGISLFCALTGKKPIATNKARIQ